MQASNPVSRRTETAATPRTNTSDRNNEVEDNIFKGLVRDPRDVQAPKGSINAQLLALPQQREYTHDMQGRVLLFPRTGIIGVPFQMHKDSYSVVVVDGSACVKENGVESYPRGGYHIDVSNLEMQTAVELSFETKQQGGVR